MSITRLGIANPQAETDTALVSVTEPHLVSVIVANKSLFVNPATRVTIWIVPVGATVDTQYAYIASNLELSVGSSFETFRFGVLAGDTVFVRSTTGATSFHMSGILQNDAAFARNVSEVFTNKTIRGTENTIYPDKGTTAARPGAVEVGYLRFNTETNLLEVYNGDDWTTTGTYNPLVAANWNEAPTSMVAALDELAARVKGLEP